MKKLIMISAVALSLSACSATTEERAAINGIIVGATVCSILC